MKQDVNLVLLFYVIDLLHIIENNTGTKLWIKL